MIGRALGEQFAVFHPADFAAAIFWLVLVQQW
jgi:hypothetical protein